MSKDFDYEVWKQELNLLGKEVLKMRLRHDEKSDGLSCRVINASSVFAYPHEGAEGYYPPTN